MVDPVKEISKPSIWTRNFILIMASNFFVFMGFQMLLPTMPVYVQQLGGTEDMVGLVIGIFTITAVALRPFAGRALDTRGRRIVYLFGLFIIVISTLSYKLMATVGMVLALRLLHGIGWGASTTAAGTVAADIIPKSRLGEGMGFYGLTTVISMATAPAIGLYIINQWGFNTLFDTSAILVFMAVIIAMLIKYRPLDTHPIEKSGKYSLYEREAYKPTVIIFFITLTYGSIVSFIALYAARFNIENIGVFFTAYAVTLLFSRPLFGRLADKKGFDYSMIPGIICIGLTMVVLFFAQNLYFFLAAAVLYGIGFGAVQPSLQAMAVYNVTPQRRGAANGTFMSGFDLGIGIGSIIWGMTAKAFGYSTMYLLTIIPVLIALGIYVYLGKVKSSIDTKQTNRI